MRALFGGRRKPGQTLALAAVDLLGTIATQNLDDLTLLQRKNSADLTLGVELLQSEPDRALFGDTPCNGDFLAGRIRVRNEVVKTNDLIVPLALSHHTGNQRRRD